MAALVDSSLPPAKSRTSEHCENQANFWAACCDDAWSRQHRRFCWATGRGAPPPQFRVVGRRPAQDLGPHMNEQYRPLRFSVYRQVSTRPEFWRRSQTSPGHGPGGTPQFDGNAVSTVAGPDLREVDCRFQDADLAQMVSASVRPRQQFMGPSQLLLEGLCPCAPPLQRVGPAVAVQALESPARH